MTRSRTRRARCRFGLVAAACGDDDDAASTPRRPRPAATDAPDGDRRHGTGADAPAGTEPAARRRRLGVPRSTDGEFGENYTPDPATCRHGPRRRRRRCPTEERARNIALATVARAVDAGRRGPGVQVLGGQRLRHRHRWRAEGRPGRRLRRQRRPPDLQDGVHPAGADVPGDRRDRLHRRQPRHAEGDLRRAQLRCPRLRHHHQLPRRRRGAGARLPGGDGAGREGHHVVGRPRSASPAPTTSPTAVTTCAPSRRRGASSSASQLPDGGDIAILLGAPGNTLDPLQEECMLETMPDNINIVASQGDAWSRESYLEGDVGDPRRAPRPRRHRSAATATRSSARSGPTRRPASRWTASSRCTSPTTTRSCAPGRTPVASRTRSRRWRC